MRLRVMVGVVCVVLTALAGAPAARAATRAPAFGESANPGGRGYVLLGADGGMFAFGGARFFGKVQNCFADAGCSSIASTPAHDGYYVAGDGCTIIGRGAAHQLGTPPRVGIGAGCRIAVAPFGIGYWLLERDGAVYNYGAGGFFGDVGPSLLPRQADGTRARTIGIAAAPTGAGYWIAADDGGVFAFGDATFHGSAVPFHPTEPIVAIAATPTGHGYWLAASDGGVFAFGDAKFSGSAAGLRLQAPVRDVIPG